MSSEKSKPSGYTKTSEPMLFVHAVYFLAKYGPVKKEDFLEHFFSYLKENSIIYEEDLEITASREGRERREKIAQIIRNLTGSHQTLTTSVLVKEHEGKYQIDGSRLAKVFSENKSSSASGGKIARSDVSSYNLVIFGPPGTGKTRAALVLASQHLLGTTLSLDPAQLNIEENPKNFADRFRLRSFQTQFHPSFSYEDFFEGLRPVNTQNEEKSELSYAVVPGIFKAASQIARAYYQPGEYGIEVQARFRKGSNSSWSFTDSPSNAIYKLEDRAGYYTYRGKIVAYTNHTGAPPPIEPANEPETSGLYQLKWYADGSEENISFVLVIDELNRGNPARIFGEALSLIEESKRIGRPEQAEITLPYSHEAFMVPPNLSIICAMNSSDKSLATLDHAFRRRFKFIYLAPSFDIVTTDAFKQRSERIFSDELLKSLRNHFQAINDALKESKIPQENYVGHSYLIKLLRDAYLEIKNKKLNPTEAEEVVRLHLRNVWENELHSLLREIVGDQRLEDFCDNFAGEVGKLKTDTLFPINEGIAKSLFKYLENIQPVNSEFPWLKKAA